MLGFPENKLQPMVKSILLTSIQFLCIGWILYFNSWLAEPGVLVLIQVAGVLLGSWAIVVMSSSKLNVTPIPRKGAVLVTAGPYRLIRHPMYTSLLLAFYPILYQNHDLANSLVFGLLLINMLLKLNYEEKLLRERFPEYKRMESKTWRLIPWIY